MTMLIYVAAAIGFLIFVFYLLVKTRSHDRDDRTPYVSSSPITGSGRWLDLSERIFNPSDARWLRDDLAFPKLAEVLVRDRKRLAIRWLEALQASFDEVVRTPELTSSEVPEASSIGSWQMLWLTVRFKILVSYALFMVKLFGPYHRLIPSFSWHPLYRESERSFRQPAMAQSRIHHE